LSGDFGGEALAQILFGKTNPSGKLPFTYPRHTGSLLTYDHKYTEVFDKDFGKTGFNPQWEFGFGLSYSNFSYANLVLSNSTFNQDDTLSFSVDITNNSEINGKEVIQVYVSDTVASITPSVKRLRGFNKKLIKANTTETIYFSIPISELAFVNNKNNWMVEPGCFILNVGNLKKSIIVE